MLETPRNFYATKTEIIAEAGCNHGGDIGKALEMVRQARSCGADTIKFQSFKTEDLVNPREVEAYCKKSELSYDDHCAIIDECEREDIKPLFSCFSIDSFWQLMEIGLTEVKIPSGQIFNYDLLREAARRELRVYVSTGMCSMKDVSRAIGILTAPGRLRPDQLVVMQCTTCYPAPFCDANLKVIERYKKEFGTPVGYSDHTPGWAAAIGAVALGASVIEKHFILNPDEDAPDACVSLSPTEFGMMVTNIRDIEQAVGTHIKRPRQCEKKMFHRRDYGGSKNDL